MDYERNEEGIIQAFTAANFEIDEGEPEDMPLETYIAIHNEQYTLIHDHIGKDAAENANFGWVEADDVFATKIGEGEREIIETRFDDDGGRKHLWIDNHGNYSDATPAVAATLDVKDEQSHVRAGEGGNGLPDPQAAGVQSGAAEPAQDRSAAAQAFAAQQHGRNM